MENLFKAFYQEGIAVGHSDSRRTIYSPSEITDGLEIKNWTQHNVIRIHSNALPLGGHHHDFEELYFAVTSGFEVHLLDIENTERRGSFNMAPGSRLLIPSYTAHRVIAQPNAVLMVYGSVPFDPARIIKSPPEVLEKLASMN